MLQISEILKLALKESSDFDAFHSGSSSLFSAGRFSSGQPPVVVWNITNNCNMLCPHCYSSASKNNTASNTVFADARKILDRLDSHGVKILILSGGEPLLNPDFFNILSYARSKGMICHLSTNGILIDKKTAMDLKEGGITYVGVSVDGKPQQNDSYRGFEGGFFRAISGLLDSRDAGMKTGLRFTLTEKNFDQLFYLINLAVVNQISRFYISHLLYSGRAERYSRFDLNHEAAETIVRKIFEFSLEQVRIQSAISIVTGGNDADGVFLYEFVRKVLGEQASIKVLEILRMRGGNTAGEKMINIDHNGNVYPDQFFRSVNCGNILEKPLAEIMEGDIIQKLFRREHYLKGRCGECSYLCICRGSHRERALFASGDIWAEDPACYLKEEFIKGKESPCAAAY